MSRSTIEASPSWPARLGYFLLAIPAAGELALLAGWALLLMLSDKMLEEGGLGAGVFLAAAALKVFIVSVIVIWTMYAPLRKRPKSLYHANIVMAVLSLALVIKLFYWGVIPW